jgi:hypothetical protein
MSKSLMLELASIAWRDAIAASDEGRFEDAAHLIATALELEEAATPSRRRAEKPPL